MTLHRIHKTLLDLVEDDDSKGEEEAHKRETVNQPAPADEFSGAKEAVFKCLEDGSDGIEAHKLVYGDAYELHPLGLA